MDKIVCAVDIEGNVFVEKSTCCNHHILYQRIIQQRGLEFEGYLDKNGHQLALYLTTLGDLNFTRENQFDVFYLGEYLSTKQVQWFKKEKKDLRKRKCSIVEYINFKEEYYDSYTLCGENSFRKLC